MTDFIVSDSHVCSEKPPHPQPRVLYVEVEEFIVLRSFLFLWRLFSSELQLSFNYASWPCHVHEVLKREAGTPLPCSPTGCFQLSADTELAFLIPGGDSCGPLHGEFKCCL